jgi:hypothetical protein
VLSSLLNLNKLCLSLGCFHFVPCLTRDLFYNHVLAQDWNNWWRVKRLSGLWTGIRTLNTPSRIPNSSVKLCMRRFVRCVSAQFLPFKKTYERNMLLGTAVGVIMHSLKLSLLDRRNGVLQDKCRTGAALKLGYSNQIPVSSFWIPKLYRKCNRSFLLRILMNDSSEYLFVTS